MKVITRFAPSPTGYLHIGGARTAIFNYLFAKHYGGKFLLRIEDTDKERSTEAATNAIFLGLNWLGIEYDDEPIFQSKNIERHREIAIELLNRGKAYKCFMEQEEIDHLRNEAIKSGKSFLFNSVWREKSEQDHPKDKPYVIRIKAPKDGVSIINDIVQGEVKVNCEVLDDFVLLRSDGTPTYMLAVVVDDHDMGITHIIRGDDHLNNAFRQKIIYESLGWEVPVMAHIPLIHGEDGAKLSKRHGAIGAEAYRELGYLPDALFNYLLRLGWSHGDDDIISKENAVKWFDGTHIGKSASRIDLNKMNFINAFYLREKLDQELIELILESWRRENISSNELVIEILKKAINEIKVRSELVTDLSNLAKIYHPDNIFSYDEEAIEVIKSSNQDILKSFSHVIENLEDFTKDNIQAKLKEDAAKFSLKIGEYMKPIRAALTGKCASPSVFEIIELIGKNTILERIVKAQEYYGKT